MKLCLGTVQFGMDYGIQGAHQQSYEKIDEIIDYAIKHGVRVFDSASAYGEAEEILGHFFRRNEVQKKGIKVVSKLAAGLFDNADKDEWAEIAVSNAQQSLDNLSVDTLEAYLFHNASYIYEPYAVNALYEVKKKGLCRRVGASIYSPEEAMKVLEYREIDAIQIPYNVFDQRLDACGFFMKARERNVQVYARSTLLQGLVMMDPRDLPKGMKFAKGYLEDFESICRKYQISKLKAAVSFVEKQEGIDYIVFGVDSLEQLKEYLYMQNETKPDETIEEIRLRYNTVEERLVNPTMWEVLR